VGSARLADPLSHGSKSSSPDALHCGISRNVRPAVRGLDHAVPLLVVVAVKVDI